MISACGVNTGLAGFSLVPVDPLTRVLRFLSEVPDGLFRSRQNKDQRESATHSHLECEPVQGDEYNFRLRHFMPSIKNWVLEKQQDYGVSVQLFFWQPFCVTFALFWYWNRGVLERWETSERFFALNHRTICLKWLMEKVGSLVYNIIWKPKNLLTRNQIHKKIFSGRQFFCVARQRQHLCRRRG